MATKRDRGLVHDFACDRQYVGIDPHPRCLHIVRIGPIEDLRPSGFSPQATGESTASSPRPQPRPGCLSGAAPVSALQTSESRSAAVEGSSVGRAVQARSRKARLVRRPTARGERPQLWESARGRCTSTGSGPARGLKPTNSAVWDWPSYRNRPASAVLIEFLQACLTNEPRYRLRADVRSASHFDEHALEEHL